MGRKIIHIDMDCFYAAVEVRDRPELKNRPVAVGGAAARRGVLCTCNYEARKFGVKGAMPTFKAMELCPQLIIIRPHFSKYIEASNSIHDIFARYTDKIESLSLDEAYLDVTNSPFYQGSATKIAAAIRQEIWNELKLTASAGIGPNKLLAKLATEIKKPNGQFTVTPDQVETFIAQVPLSKIWGVGRVTTKEFEKEGWKYCHDLYPFSRFELTHMMGRFGDSLYDFIRGIDEREVEMHSERKSLGVEETFNEDLTDLDILRSKLAELVDSLDGDYQNHTDREVKSFQVKIKYHDFTSTTIERGFTALTIEQAWPLFLERWQTRPEAIRLLGVSLKFQSEKEDSPQLSFDSLEMIS